MNALPFPDEPDEPTEGERKAAKVAAFAAHGPRYASLAQELLGAPDPTYALAHLLADHEARLDIAMRRIAALEFALDQSGTKRVRATEDATRDAAETMAADT